MNFTGMWENLPVNMHRKILNQNKKDSCLELELYYNQKLFQSKILFQSLSYIEREKTWRDPRSKLMWWKDEINRCEALFLNKVTQNIERIYV